ncbi:PadR family transcriptional regulator [Paenibacillus antri]|uniref:PadR family transcriptional regulator n=1 Tax=Paenibacillus antri TaxID=2582848 RepID=A0A5R9G9T6_9BACL|nr:PadR family transcriptional regulator [Paenibacillus antri]TLS53202.1 PadR family transcriptional regulator [Paenibacillus antri]
MEYVVLGLLILKSQTLYELNKAFQQGIALFYSASYGSLQTTLKKSLNQGHIGFHEQVDNGRNKKVYFITEAGTKAFMEWMEAELPTSRLESAALTKVFFLGLIDGAEKRRFIIQEIIDKIKSVQTDLQRMDKRLQQIQAPDAHSDTFAYQRKTLDYGIEAHRFARRWFEDLLAELRQLE